MWHIGDLTNALPYMSDLELRVYLQYMERYNITQRRIFAFSDVEMSRIVQILPDEVQKIRHDLARLYRLIKSTSIKGEIYIILDQPYKRGILKRVLKGEEKMFDEWRCPLCGHQYVTIQTYGRLHEMTFGELPSELISPKYLYTCINCGTTFRDNKDLMFTEILVFIIPEQESAKRRLNWVVQKYLGKVTLDDMGEWKKLTDTAYAFLDRAWEDYAKHQPFRLHDTRYTVRKINLTDARYFDRLARADIEAEIERRQK